MELYLYLKTEKAISGFARWEVLQNIMEKISPITQEKKDYPAIPYINVLRTRMVIYG